MTSFEYNFIIKHFPTLQRLKTYMSKYHGRFMNKKSKEKKFP